MVVSKIALPAPMTVIQFMPPKAGLMRKLGGAFIGTAPAFPLCTGAACFTGDGAAIAESGGPYCSGAAVGVYVNCGVAYDGIDSDGSPSWNAVFELSASSYASPIASSRCACRRRGSTVYLRPWWCFL